MKFGLDKCKTICITRGKVTKTQDPDVLNISEMEENDVYKYLVMTQNNRIDKRTVKNTLTMEFKSRIRRTAKSNLSGKFVIKALNTFAIPIITYSFGIIKWSTTELQVKKERRKGSYRSTNITRQPSTITTELLPPQVRKIKTYQSSS